MTHLRQIRDSRSRSYTYLLADTDRREAIIIDPVAGQTTMYLALLDEIRARLSHILLTHFHRFEATGATDLQKSAGARLVLGERCAATDAGMTLAVRDGDVVVFGNEVIRCRATPGHTPGCVTYLWRDRAFVGDALAFAQYSAAEQEEIAVEDPGVLFDSVTRKLLTLPDETLVYPAHEYSGHRVTCVAEQRDSNPSLTGATRDEFIAKRTQARRPTEAQHA
jgi:glyoxylase-like metal-dependent hydrolase (beta-lactamase superfamily II)